MAPNDFAVLMQRFLEGDENAAATLVEMFEPQIRRSIRIRSTGTRLQRVLDSADVCQSVLRRLWENRDDPNLPTNSAGLVAWLLTVARHRACEVQRQQHAARRGGGKLREISTGTLNELPVPGKSPASEVADREHLQRVLEALTPAERMIAEARAAGATWEVLARDLETTPEALRKRYRRATQRVEEQMTRNGLGS